MKTVFKAVLPFSCFRFTISLMRKDELMLDYAQKCFDKANQVKKEIRDRSQLFYGIGFPVFFTAFFEVYKQIKQISCCQTFSLAMSGVCLFIASVFFVLIFAPSKQNIYLASDMVGDIVDFKATLKKAGKDPDELTEEESESFAYEYFFRVYSEEADEYEKVNRKFQIFFLIMALFQILAFVFLAITLVI
jgi:hypothetical protein